MSCRPTRVSRALGLVLLLVVFAGVLTAQSYTVVDSARLPAESFVGDAVELRYVVRTTEELRAPAQPPEPAWGEVSSVRVAARDGEYDVRIVVTPYEPGTLTLPPIDLEGISLEGLSLVVASVLEEDSELRTIYGPQRLPGTRFALFAGVVGVVVPLVLALYLLGPGRPVIRRLITRYRARIPHRTFLRRLDQLESNLKHDTARDFYTGLVAALQDLMSSRLEFDCHAATSTELRAYLPAFASRCGATAAEAAPLAEVFTAADEAKFAHQQIRRKMRTRHLECCREILTALELSRRKHRASGGRRSSDRRRSPSGEHSHARV